MLNLFKKFWPLIILSFILTIIITLNFHPGKIVMGNDNFSPEINPTLTIKRSFLNPAWRDYRVLGIPSDSEQGDVWRSFIFWFGNKILPTWMTSQVYMFATLVVGVISMGKVVQLLTKNSKSAQFFGSLLYLFSPITAWVYFYPVHLFVAAYAFTPLVLWALLRVILNPSTKNKFFLLLSSLIMGTTALTATMFITSSLTIIGMSFLAVTHSKKLLKNWSIGLFIFILPQLFWVIPFATYVKSNNQALQDSYINREITSTTVQSEQSNNTIWNTLQFSTAWMDTKEDDQNYTYPYRDWFKNNLVGIYLGYIPAVLALIGIVASLTKIKKNYDLLFISLIGVFGWILLSGNNPPFNQIYGFFDKNIPLFHQVFRWGSSKFWPILMMPMLILAVKGIETLIKTKFAILKVSFFLAITLITIYATHPIITNHFIREELFVDIPSAYSSLKDNLSNQGGLIDTTPHTNTRYFRRHDWGFWGSVFLNYLLPNPITEKALIIGSYENEASFNTLNESYYSGDPNTYTSSLSRFNIFNVLSDKSVTNQGLGSSYSFPYHWDLHDQMVTSNPGLVKTWSQDFLSLYKTNHVQSSTTFSVSPNHNYETLNKSLAILNNNDNYTTSAIGSSIYPLSQNATEITTQNSSLLLNSMPSIAGEYGLSISKDTLSSMSLTAQVKNQNLILTPYFPLLLKNSTPIYQLPQSTTPLSSDTITIGDRLIASVPTLITPELLSQTSIWTKTSTQDLTLGVTDVECNKNQASPSNKSCHSTDFDTKEPSVIRVASTFTSNAPTLVDICLHSYLQSSCLNSPNTVVATTTLQTVAISSNNVVAEGDNIVIFIVTKTVDNSSPQLIVSDLTLTQLTSPKPLTIESPFLADINQSIVLSPSDVITSALPVTTQIPPFQIFQSTCPERGQPNDITHVDNIISFTTSNCFDGLYSSFSLPDSLGATAILTYAKTSDTQGIPLEYSLKQPGVERKITTDLLSTTKDIDFLKFSILPTTDQNFNLELINRGIGKTASINSLSDFVSIPIPTSWLGLKLSPTTSQPSSILTTMSPFITGYNTGTFISEINANSHVYTLPTATSPYWKAVILAQKPTNILSLYFQVITRSEIKDKTLVNGWQPAWEINGDHTGEYLAVIFLPNVLAYLGLILGLGIAFVLVFAVRATKSGETHTVSQ